MQNNTTPKDNDKSQESESIKKFDNYFKNLRNALMSIRMNEEDSEHFFTLKLLLCYNNVLRIPIENINSTLKQLYNMETMPSEIGYVVYTNPIHACMLLALAEEEQCKQTIAVMLNELNIIPAKCKVPFTSKQMSLQFYARIFGASVSELLLLESLINLNMNKKITYFEENLSLKRDLKLHVSSEKNNKKSLDTFTDFISIKYNDVTAGQKNIDYINSKLKEDLEFPLFTSSDDGTTLARHVVSNESLENEHNIQIMKRLRTEAGSVATSILSDIDLLRSFVITLDTLSSDEHANIVECVKREATTKDYDFNMKRICKNMFLKKMTYDFSHIQHKFKSIDDLTEQIRNLKNAFENIEKAVCFEVDVNSIINNPKEYKSFKFANKRQAPHAFIDKFTKVSSPVELSRVYKEMYNKFI